MRLTIWWLIWNWKQLKFQCSACFAPSTKMSIRDRASHELSVRLHWGAYTWIKGPQSKIWCEYAAAWKLWMQIVRWFSSHDDSAFGALKALTSKAWRIRNEYCMKTQMRKLHGQKMARNSHDIFISDSRLNESRKTRHSQNTSTVWPFTSSHSAQMKIVSLGVVLNAQDTATGGISWNV